MPKLKPNAVPSYRLHRQSGQAIVTLSGRDVLLGAHGTLVSREAYDRAVSEWISNGRRWPDRNVDLSVAELLVQFWQHAQGYYGTSRELDNFKYALRPLKKMYAETSAAAFGPLALKGVRDSIVAKGVSRGYVNQCIARIKRVFKWATENELVPSSVLHGLHAVSGLRYGRTAARETDPVRPVPDQIIDATLPHLCPTVRAMVELQLRTGMRPGEVCVLRTCDLETGGRVWCYTPESHKTQHHGHARTIWIGPKAQEVLKPFLRLDTRAYLFSPAEAEMERHAMQRSKRMTPLSPSQNARGEQARLRTRHRPPGDRYEVSSYRRAINRACDIAFPPPENLRPYPARAGSPRETKQAFLSRLTPAQKAELCSWWKSNRWHPHRLRHSAATRLRKEYGIEVARVILGHRSAAVTEVYAEMDTAKAKDVMAQVG